MFIKTKAGISGKLSVAAAPAGAQRNVGCGRPHLVGGVAFTAITTRV